MFGSEQEYQQYNSDMAYAEAENSNASAQADYEQEMAKAEYEEHLVNTMPAVRKISFFPTTKQGQDDAALNILQAIEDGMVPTLKIHMFLKAVEGIATRLTVIDPKKNKMTGVATKYKSLLEDAANEYPGKSFEFNNAQWTKRDVGGKYDYTKCGDPVLVDLYKRQSDIDTAVKEREEFLKAISDKGQTIVIEETGETVTVYPPAKPASTSSISVSFK